MHVEFLVEEPSMETLLDKLAPQLLPYDTTWKVITFRGKPDLLQKLPGRLKGYAYRSAEVLGVVVLVDKDRDDCQALKASLESAAARAGLTTQSTGAHFRVLNRIVIEELEAWLFGDAPALRQAFPRLPAGLSSQKTSRHPDAIRGGTAEALERLLQQHGYFPNGMPKRAVAGSVGQHLRPQDNTSPSFRVFVAGLERLVASLTPARVPDGTCA